MAETLYEFEEKGDFNTPFWCVDLESQNDSKVILSGKSESPYFDAIGEFELTAEETKKLYLAMKKFYEKTSAENGGD